MSDDDDFEDEEDAIYIEPQFLLSDQVTVDRFSCAILMQILFQDFVFEQIPKQKFSSFQSVRDREIGLLQV